MDLGIDFEKDIARFIPELNSKKGFSIEIIQPDGSTRSFYRINSKEKKGCLQSYIIMRLNNQEEIDALKTHSYSWLNINQHWTKNGIKVPKVLGVIQNKGLILQEDLGNMTLESKIEQTNEPEQTYKKAIELLLQIQKLPLTFKSQTTHFTNDVFYNELLFFKKHFLDSWLSLNLNENDSKHFEKEAKLLCEYEAKLPQCVCHRDFHSRNIIIPTKGHHFGIVDSFYLFVSS